MQANPDIIAYSEGAYVADDGSTADLFEVARAMAEGALMHSRASLAVAITGVAGPGGGRRRLC